NLNGPFQPLPMRISMGVPNAPQVGGGLPVYSANGGGDPLDPAVGVMQMGRRFSPPVIRMVGHWNPLPIVTQVNPGAGNLGVQFVPPAANPLDGQPAVAYNSSSPATSEYGFGMQGAFKRTASGNGNTGNPPVNVKITASDGTV